MHERIIAAFAGGLNEERGYVVYNRKNTDALLLWEEGKGRKSKT